MTNYFQSLYSGIIRVVANLLMVCAIFIAMYNASRWPTWPSEAVFCLIFFGITIPVWLVAYLLLKWIRRKWPQPNQSMILLPGLGPQLVEWKVIERDSSFPLT